MIRPDDRYDPGRRPEGPIDVDRLDYEGPLATKWGVVSAGASQRSFFAWIGVTVIRLVFGPYVMVLRSRWPTWGKVTAFALLATAYALLFAALLLIPGAAPSPR